MTTSKLDAIAARLESATPGPWEAVTDDDGRTKEHSVWSEQSSDYVAEWIVTKPDADLIAHAPADLAALLAVVEALLEARRDLTHNHLHRVPGRWDKDGSFCDVCARVGALDDALAALTKEETDGR